MKETTNNELNLRLMKQNPNGMTIFKTSWYVTIVTLDAIWKQFVDAIIMGK